MKSIVIHRLIRKNFFLPLLLVSIYLGAAEVNIDKVGEWGTGNYLDVSVQGNYAYCAGGSGGLEIIDIGVPASPVRVGKYTVTGDIVGIHVSGNTAYAAHRSGGLMIFDIRTPSAPILAGTLALSEYPWRVMSSGNYVYVTDPGEGFFIVDVSVPSSPSLAGSFNGDDIGDLYVVGSFVYLTSGTRLKIIDCSKPAALNLVANYELPSFAKSVFVKDNYAYVGVSRTGLYIFDVSDPSNPVSVGSVSDEGYYEDVVLGGNFAYLSGPEGFGVIDVTNPETPFRVGSYLYNGKTRDTLQLAVSGTNVFVPYHYGGLDIVDVSAPATPRQTGIYRPSWVSEFAVKDNYLYIIDGFNKKFDVVDISSPSAPERKYSASITCCADDIDINGNYIYIANWYGFDIYDVSTPPIPLPKGSYSTVTKNVYEISSFLNYVYLMVEQTGLRIIDVSDPDIPVEKSELGIPSPTEHIFPNDDYIYVPNGVLDIYNVTDPASPFLAGTYMPIYSVNHAWIGNNRGYLATSGGLEIIDLSKPVSPLYSSGYGNSGGYYRVFVKDNFAYMTNNNGLYVVDVSDTENPVLAGTYNTSAAPTAVFTGENNRVYLQCDGKVIFLQVTVAEPPPFQLNLNRSTLYFASTTAGHVTGTQSFLLNTTSTAYPGWTVSGSGSWLDFSPKTGNGNSEIFVSVNTEGLTPGTYTGTVTVSAANGSNGPQNVDVFLEVYADGTTGKPFGTFSTPQNGSTVSSSVPVTGWALDDIGIKSVKIYKEGVSGNLIYIDDALLVEGARDDVMRSYPTYPANHLAGWGYMMLSNYLPGGDGTHIIHAIAADAEGNTFDLGSKTITVDNADAVKPFGAIDTPVQGGGASGDRFKVFGWALTPQPNTIPTDGSTIRIQVDGVTIGGPVYNQFRQDIANFFPGYNNTDGAVGYFYLDTTAYENGIHTIQWTVKDDAGNTDGIGSRFFKIMNTRASQRSEPQSGLAGIREILTAKNVTGAMNKDLKHRLITIRELETLKIPFPHGSIIRGGSMSGNQILALPIGSRLDQAKGEFNWMPGPGFVGDYPLVFIVEKADGTIERHNIVVRIVAKHSHMK